MKFFKLKSVHIEVNKPSLHLNRNFKDLLTKNYYSLVKFGTLGIFSRKYDIG